MSYFKQNEFENYLKVLGQNPNSYGTSVNAVFNNKLKGFGLSNPFVNSSLICTQNDLVGILDTLIKLMMYAYSTNNNSVISIFKISKPRTLYNYACALTTYKDFIDKNSFKSKRDKNCWPIWQSNFDAQLKVIMGMLRVDGNESLFKLFSSQPPSNPFNSSVQSFLSYVLQYCYFFDPSDAEAQHKKILEDILSKKHVPARNSTSHINGMCDGIHVKSDKNGNAPVVALIQEKTGYSVSKGEDSLFTNYKISHIWQNAWHPLYFTNLWNIVLVPAWANDILDKTKTQDLRTKQIIDTFRQICITHYKMSNLDFTKYSSNLYQEIIDPASIQNNNAISGTYNIKVIQSKKDIKINNSNIGNLLGEIVDATIRI